MNKHTLIPLGIFIFALCLYALTLHPFFPIGDSAEFIVAAKTFGVSHSPGAPLYTILSYIFAHTPTGNFIINLNFLSALFGSLTALLIFLILKLATKNSIASVFGALFLAVSYIFWFFSTITELYTLSIFTVVLVIYLYLLFKEKKSTKLLYLLFFSCALSIMVHYINILPFFFILASLFIQHKKNIKLKRVIFSCLFFFLGLLPLLIIPFAASSKSVINWSNVHDAQSFLNFVIRTDYQVTGSGEVGNFNLAEFLGKDLIYYFTSLFLSFTGALLLALFAFLKKGDKSFKVILLLNFIFLGPIFIAYANFPINSPYPDVAINHKRLMQQVYIFSFPFIALLSGLGIHFLLTRFKSKKLKNLFISLVTIVVLINFVLSLQKINSGRNELTRYYGESVLNNINKPTILITGTEESNIFNYLYAVEGKNKENIRLITFSLMQHKWYVDQLKERYPDVIFPFDKISVGQKLDSFYEENSKRFSIVFAPIDDQAIQSIPDKFIPTPYGLSIELVSKDKLPTKEKFLEENKKIYNSLVEKYQLTKSYSDLSTNELLMSYARAYTNVGIKSINLEDEDQGLFFLNKANEFSPQYHTPYKYKAKIYERRKDYLNSAKEFVNIFKYDPDNLINIRNIAVSYGLAGDKLKALEYAKLYLERAQTPEQKIDAENIYNTLRFY